MTENTDYYILQENDKYVMYYSIAQICIAIVSGTIQVIFIKKLFASNNSNRKYQQKA